MKTIAERTIKNPRWWVSLPIVLPTFIIIMVIFYSAYAIGEVADAVASAAWRAQHWNLPKWMLRMQKWMYEENVPPVS